MGQALTNLPLGLAPRDAVVVEQLNDLEQQIIQLMLESQGNVNTSLTEIRNLVEAVQGMSPAGVETLIRQILSESFTPAQIEQIIITQSSALIAQFQQQLSDFSSRLAELETRLEQHEGAIDQLQETVQGQSGAISGLLQTDRDHSTAIERLNLAIQKVQILVVNGLIESTVGIDATAVTRECEGSTFVNFIIRSTSRLFPEVKAILESTEGKFNENLGYSYLDIDPLSSADVGLVYGNKIQITVPKAATHRLLLD
jgi:prefoldin subunit 5